MKGTITYPTWGHVENHHIQVIAPLKDSMRSFPEGWFSVQKSERMKIHTMFFQRNLKFPPMFKRTTIFPHSGFGVQKKGCSKWHCPRPLSVGIWSRCSRRPLGFLVIFWNLNWKGNCRTGLGASHSKIFRALWKIMEHLVQHDHLEMTSFQQHSCFHVSENRISHQPQQASG